MRQTKQPESLSELAYALNLKTIQNCHSDVIEEATAKHWPYDTFLKTLFEQEYNTRQENSTLRRLKAAGFPQLKYLEDIDRKWLSEDARHALVKLETLDFIRDGNNVILMGNPGTGKTHIATALGIKACKQRMSVLYTSVPHLITQIKECKSSRTLHAYESRFEKYDLVICDEFGYIACDKEGGELLFNHLSLRSECKSTIITTNLAFDRWNEVIKDKVLVNALADRLLHKAYIVNMTSESYRLKETKTFNEKFKDN